MSPCNQSKAHYFISRIIIIMNFYSPVSNTKCYLMGHKMRIARIKIRVDGRLERIKGDGKE